MNNQLIHKPNYYYMLLPVIICISKIFINIYYLFHVIPLLHNIIPVSIIVVYNIIQIFISITYSIKGKVQYYDKIDYLSIIIKLLITSYMFYIVHISILDNIIFHLLSHFNVIYTLYIFTISLILRDNINYICLKEKYNHISIISILTLLQLVLYTILYKYDVNAILGVIFIITGGILWIYKIPEGYMKTRYIDSVGLLHVCVIIGDIFLINTIGYN